MAKIALALGKENDHQHYLSLNAKIREAFADEYIASDGRLPAHYQGMYVLALKMNMIPAEKRPLLTNQLVDLILQNEYRLDTGFVSVPYLLDVLCDNGRLDIAYKLLFQTECPSWLYEVEKGATTIWETWDAITPDGQVNLASFNHYAFGCVGDWIYRFVAGLDKSQPGYKHIVIQPNPHENLTHARASYQSVYGEVVSAWELRNGMMRVQVTIPPNTTATIHLPDMGNQDAVEVGSGSYEFEYPV
jgi:alpha-L-rhamnosidase